MKDSKMADELANDLELLANLRRQMPEVEEEVDRIEELLAKARSNVEYVRDGYNEVLARVCNALMPPNTVVPGPKNAGTNSEEDISVYGTDVAFAEGVEARLQNIPIECNPGEGVDATAWDAGWTEADTTITLHEQTDTELLAELDAPVSVLDDPELIAAASRAEATLAAAKPNYVGLQDPELDADWDAMKEREKADKPKLHFSIFGERGNRKLEEV